MTDRIRAGTIEANSNYGWSKQAHPPALLGMPGFELTPVCTSLPETASDSSAFYDARMALHDYREMAGHPEVGPVAVTVSVPAHHGMVMGGLGRARTCSASGPQAPRPSRRNNGATWQLLRRTHSLRPARPWRTGAG